MRTRSVVLASFTLAVALLTGCGGETPPPEAPPPPAKSAEPPPAPTPEVKKEEPPPPPPKKEEPPPPPPKKKASEVITGGGMFAFSLADSADAKKLATDDCEKKAKKDEKKKEACLKDVDASAANEGIRFEKDDKGNWWWVSFGKEKDKEVVYNKVMFKIASEADGKITLKPEGKDGGKRPMAKLPAEVVLDVPDDNTVSMTDPKKGKLVYKKK